MQPIPERKYLSIHNPHSPKCQTPPPSGIRWADMSCSRPSGSSGSQQTSRHSDTVVLMQPQLYSPLLLAITFPRTANLRARNRTPCYPSIHPYINPSTPEKTERLVSQLPSLEHQLQEKGPFLCSSFLLELLTFIPLNCDNFTAAAAHV